MRLTRSVLIAASIAASLSFTSVASTLAQASPDPAVEDATQEAEAVTPSPATEWTELADAPWASEKNWWITDTGTTPDGAVVVAASPLGGAPTVWRSTDMETWDVATPAKVPETSSWSSLLGTPWGIDLRVATPDGSAMLWSSSDGADWIGPTRTRDTNVPGSDVSDGLVLLAGAAGTSDKMVPTLWRSTDGQTYEQLSLGDVRKKAIAGDVAPLPGGELLMTTFDTFGREPQLHVGNWGADWETVELPASPRTETAPVRLASLPTGVVMSIREDERTSLWFSTNGADWDEVADAKGEPGLVQSGGSVYLVPGLFMSSDGRDWCRIKGPVDEGFNMSGLAVTQDGGLVIGGFTAKDRKKGGGTTFLPLVLYAASPVCVPIDEL